MIQQSIECPQRAQPLAKRAVKQHTQHSHRQQNGEFPGKEAAQGPPNAGIGKRQGDRPLQHPLGAEVLAEVGVSHAHIVHQEGRQEKHRHQQNGVLQIGQRF